MTRRRFFTLDVFTGQPFAGNPLAVVLDSAGLDDDAMQTIAREFNLSETVFIFPPQDGDHRADLRIFTPGRELPFAGHPTVGTAVLLGILDANGSAGPAQFILGEKAGPVACAVTTHGPDRGEAIFALPKLPERLSAAYDRAAVAALFSLPVDAIGLGAHEAALFSAGVPFPFIPVSSRAALDALTAPSGRDMEKLFGAGLAQAFLYCREPRDPQHHFYARMFAPGMGVPEDPATGSAVAALAGAILQFEKPADGAHRFIIEQGYAMGRPSDIALTLEVRDGALVKAHIGGRAVIVSEGMLRA